MPIVPIGIWQNKGGGSEREIMCFWKGKDTAISGRSLGFVLTLVTSLSPPSLSPSPPFSSSPPDY